MIINYLITPYQHYIALALLRMTPNVTTGHQNSNMKIVNCRNYKTKLPCNNIHIIQTNVALCVESAINVPYYQTDDLGLYDTDFENIHSLYVVSWYTIPWDFDIPGLIPNNKGKYSNRFEIFLRSEKNTINYPLHDDTH